MNYYIINKKDIDKVDSKYIDYCCKRENEVVLYCDKSCIKDIKCKKINDSPLIKKLKSNILNRRSISKLGSYHFQNDLEYFFDTTVNNYSDIASYEIIGKSVENRSLLMMKITGNSDVINKSSVLYIANIHGDETIGRELCIYLIDFICKNYNLDDNLKKIVNNTNIFIMPSLNPDGFENRDYLNNWNPTRFNSNNIDLNRDFPDIFRNDDNTSDNRQPETKAIMVWSKNNKINISLSMHSGAIVVNYPLDGPTSNVYSKSNHDEYFRKLSKDYSKNVSYFKDSEFEDGITNGAKWYALTGGMQDWRYNYENGFEITLELSNEKIVDERNITYFCEQNKNALLNTLYRANTGIRGFIGFRNNNDPINIYISDTNRDYKVNLINNYFLVNYLINGSYILHINDNVYPFVIENGKMLNFETNKFLDFDNYNLFKLSINNNITNKKNINWILIIILVIIFIIIIVGIIFFLRSKKRQRMSDMKKKLKYFV